MKKIVTFSEDDIKNVRGFLNGITVTGTQNCKLIAMISQVLESGVLAEMKETTSKKEGEK